MCKGLPPLHFLIIVWVPLPEVSLGEDGRVVEDHAALMDPLEVPPGCASFFHQVMLAAGSMELLWDAG